jgi:aminoglycoside phosphotransferase (APT) family kinase protein
MATDDAAALASFIESQLGGDTDVDIVDLERVGTGRSRENWYFTATWSADGISHAEELIVRRDPLGGLLETDRRTEFEILEALETTAVPAPRVRWLDPDGSELGRPSLVMVREHGDCDYYVLGSDRPAEERTDLARRLCDLLVTVHQVDWRSVGLGKTLADPGADAAAAAVNEWEAILQRDELEPYPELELAARWLRQEAPRSSQTVLVHSDFKVGNVLTGTNNEIVALLDWELAHLGDLHEDLGWITQPLRTREHYVFGHWERAELLDHYQQSSGVEIDHEAVVWWNVMSCYKTAVMQASGLRSFVEGRADELYQPSAAVLTALLEMIDR